MPTTVPSSPYPVLLYDRTPYDRLPDCLHAGDAAEALPIHAVRPTGLPDLLTRLPASQAAYLRACGFSARAAQTILLPDVSGALGGAVLGLGECQGPHVYGALPSALPAGTIWKLASGVVDFGEAVLGYALGAYRFDRLRSHCPPACARLLLPRDAAMAETASAIRATWLVRDLVNMPANLLGPAELAETARAVLADTGTHLEVITDALLTDRYPVVHAVGRAGRQPAVVLARWRSENAGPESPLLSICGKGVCFDSGGYDIKPSSGMLRMKKDMGGAAVALGLARMIIDANLPVRLELRLGCVENMISGDAMRPLDILRTRRGTTIEVGNTDAEGRLVLSELLAEAAEATPAVLLDFATLTGAARTALGPDLPALFSNDDGLADMLSTNGRAAHDPVWRLPLWDGYNLWLDSNVSDLNNVSDKAHAGAIVAALFLQRFVPAGVRWAHFDIYAWNDAGRPGLPAGGEAQAMRAAFRGLKQFVATFPA